MNREELQNRIWMWSWIEVALKDLQRANRAFWDALNWLIFAPQDLRRAFRCWRRARRFRRM